MSSSSARISAALIATQFSAERAGLGFRDVTRT
jgi:hypothetical protein